jgi:hypothetical protein
MKNLVATAEGHLRYWKSSHEVMTRYLHVSMSSHYVHVACVMVKHVVPRMKYATPRPLVPRIKVSLLEQRVASRCEWISSNCKDFESRTFCCVSADRHKIHSLQSKAPSYQIHLSAVEKRLVHSAVASMLIPESKLTFVVKNTAAQRQEVQVNKSIIKVGGRSSCTTIWLV